MKIMHKPAKPPVSTKQPAPAQPAPARLTARGVRALRALVEELGSMGSLLGEQIKAFVLSLEALPDRGASQLSGALMRCNAFVLIAHAVRWAVALETRLRGGGPMPVLLEPPALDPRARRRLGAVGLLSSLRLGDPFAQIARLSDAEVMARICRDLQEAATMLGCPEIAARVAGIAAEAAVLLADPSIVAAARPRPRKADAASAAGPVVAAQPARGPAAPRTG